MFTIQYGTVDGENKMQTFTGSRRELVSYLASFEHPIVAVFEQVTVITKTVREEMRKIPLNTMSRAARDFARNL